MPVSCTIDEAFALYGGGCFGRRKIKAARMGEGSGPYFRSEQSLLSLRDAAGAVCGDASAAVRLTALDETVCIPQDLCSLLSLAEESCCGKCGGLRDHCRRMHQIAAQITEGKGGAEALDLLRKLGGELASSAVCGVCRGVGEAAVTALDGFGEEFSSHVEKGVCPVRTCPSLISYTINQKCRGCMMCEDNCPVGAISGEPLKQHTIDQNKCVKCGKCLRSCKFRAVVKS